MATVKVKFRASTVAEREGMIFYQKIHRRVTRQIKSGCYLIADEWNGSEICFGAYPDRNRHLRACLLLTAIKR